MIANFVTCFITLVLSSLTMASYTSKVDTLSRSPLRLGTVVNWAPHPGTSLSKPQDPESTRVHVSLLKTNRGDPGIILP